VPAIPDHFLAVDQDEVVEHLVDLVPVLVPVDLLGLVLRRFLVAGVVLPLPPARERRRVRPVDTPSPAAGTALQGPPPHRIGHQNRPAAGRAPPLRAAPRRGGDEHRRTSPARMRDGEKGFVLVMLATHRGRLRGRGGRGDCALLRSGEVAVGDLDEDVAAGRS